MRKHDIRLAVLVALQRPAYPVSLDQLAESLDIQAAGVSRAEIVAELPGLIDHGYLLDHMPQVPYNALRITAKGRDQVTRDARLDEYIYGAIAH